MTKIVVVGGGQMGRALVGGLLRSGWIAPEELAVVETNDEARHELEHRFAGITIAEKALPAGAAVLAVKPADAEAAMAAIVASGATKMVSIVAGLPISCLERWAGAGLAVLRAMPNVPAVLGAGATAVAGGASVTEEEYDWAEAVLSCFGVVARVPEKLLDAVTGLSGSGPAYVFLLAEALIDAGVEQGIDREVSRLLVNHTLLGAARLLVETGDPAATLRGAVTSPNGTTAAGLHELEAHGVRAAVLDAVAAATRKSQHLGRGFRPRRGPAAGTSRDLSG